MTIEAVNLSKRFGSREAVYSVSLSVPKGAAYALIGANGAGKTTTLKMLMNILRPDSGAATVLGVDSRQLSYRDFQRIGFVSEAQQLPERLTVGQYFDTWRPFYPHWDRALEQELCARFELPRDLRIDRLSHGMRVKAMLLGALAFRPELLILDEPLSGLDPLVRDEIVAGVLRQADETTIVISSHELTEIESFATHAAFMSGGRVVLAESTETLATRFREVSVTLSRAGRACEGFPDTWFKPELSGQTLRFIDMRFTDEADLEQQLEALFGRIERVDAMPLSLLDISKTLLRAGRAKEAA